MKLSRSDLDREFAQLKADVMALSDENDRLRRINAKMLAALQCSLPVLQEGLPASANIDLIRQAVRKVQGAIGEADHDFCAMTRRHVKWASTHVLQGSANAEHKTLEEERAAVLRNPSLKHFVDLKALPRSDIRCGKINLRLRVPMMVERTAIRETLAR